MLRVLSLLTPKSQLKKVRARPSSVLAISEPAKRGVQPVIFSYCRRSDRWSRYGSLMTMNLPYRRNRRKSRGQNKRY